MHTNTYAYKANYSYQNTVIKLFKGGIELYICFFIKTLRKIKQGGKEDVEISITKSQVPLIRLESVALINDGKKCSIPIQI